MQVVCSCNPLIGHLHPMLPVARALREAGHAVTFVSAPELEPAVRSEGFAFRGAGPDFATVLTDAMNRGPDAPLVTSRDQQRFGFERLFSAVRLDLCLSDLRDAIDELGPDLVLNEPADFVGPLVAARRNIPNATVGVGLVLLAEWIECAARGVANAWIAAGLDPPADAGLYRGLYLNQWPTPLQRQSVHELRAVQDLRPVAFGIGTPLSGDLEHLGRDRPLVYVTFGTVFGSTDALSDVLDGIEDVADVDVLVTTGPDLDPAPVHRRHPGVMVRRFVPQAPVLARTRLAITHGGAGSVIGPLCFGVPLLVIPTGADQEENAARVEVANVGRALLPGELTPASLRSRLTETLHDGDVAGAARGLRDRIDAMPAARDVVPVLEELTPPG